MKDITILLVAAKGCERLFQENFAIKPLNIGRFTFKSQVWKKPESLKESVEEGKEKLVGMGSSSWKHCN